jgi:branched-chain amino acid aminotransferase
MLWLNGRLLPESEVRIDPADRGLLLGDGVFETMRAVRGAVPLLDRHLARLRAAAAFLELTPPATDAAIARACRKLLVAHGQGDAALRLTLTRGPGPRGLRPPARPAPTLMLTASPLAAAPSVSRAAVALGARRNERSPTSRIKALSYLDNLLALREVQAFGAEQALMLNSAGRLACAASANLFLLERDELVTPPLEEGALPGITRGLVLELVREVGVSSREAPLPPERLATAEAVFTTSSLAGLVQLVMVGGEREASAEVHPVVRDLAQRWERRLGLGRSIP